MYPEMVQRYGREKNLSPQDAAQTFLQVMVLKHISLPAARFMGGTALTLGYGNPRFSEDIDLAQVSNPELLRPGLVRAVAELQGWFGSPVKLTPPKPKGRTWRITIRLGRAEFLSLHIDSQRYQAYSTQPIVIQFPAISSFVLAAMKLEEILAEKIIAVAYRRYLGGRDLFDLWFHWLREPVPSEKGSLIRGYLEKKIKERSLSFSDFLLRLKKRVSPAESLDRARREWKRYLPQEFQKPADFKAILDSCQNLPEFLR